ncbi:MAG: hypothetical protein PHP04_13010 [Bacteroidales bacterium]|nr:hypothetical protein [Bacteroidales bacterium]
MKKICLTSLIAFICTILTCSMGFAQDTNRLKIDPLLLVSLEECRHITHVLGNGLFSGWDFKSTPVLFYRPGVQEILISYPHQPAGFSRYRGFNPLGDKNIYVRDGNTTVAFDDQNTSREIDSIPVLVVADPFSTMRNQFRDILGRPNDFAEKWLDDWEFVPDPYFKLNIILHESFHVYQQKKAPDKFADESALALYPLLDPENNALYVLEGNILKDALLASPANSNPEAVKKFVAVRTYRQSRLDSNSVVYENLNEYQEGLAKYVEYKFMKAGDDVRPGTGMQYQQGFHGYKGVLSKHFRDELDNMVKIVAVSDDRFGNKFGSGPLRFKLYDLGACQALLLDELYPEWKNEIFKPGVYLTGLLQKALNMSNTELEKYLALAKSEYHYQDALTAKIEFEKEGRKKIEEKVQSIMNTEKTLVVISYKDLNRDAIIARYTPFGITQINKQSAIYDLVPLLVFFKKGCKLDFKTIVPVILDEEKKQVIFAVDSAPGKFAGDSEGKLDLNEFSLTSVNDIRNEQNIVMILLK